MIRTVILAAFSLVCLVPLTAKAACVETGSAMHPHCGMGLPSQASGNPFAGVRSIRVTMHRVRHRRAPRYRAHRPVPQGLQTLFRTGSGRAIGLIRSSSGSTAHVAGRATAAFQCLVDALDRQGYPIRFMGGWRAHGSVRGSLHPAGLALDVNQYRRNVTRPRMPDNEVALANRCGLISGRQWAWGDSGHFQLGGWAGRGRHYASHRYRHQRHHYASAH